MEVELLEQAKKDLSEMDNSAYVIFKKHLKKIADLLYQRHLKHGMPFYVEEVGQGRIIFRIEEDVIYIIRCFRTHKDYEKWYRSYTRIRDFF
jgi:mRNA-degrading endonuclease RelE of RelBE toxin-antitoxin system